MRLRVVCGLFDTMAIFSPQTVFSRVDLPTFGLPTIAKNAVFVMLIPQMFLFDFQSQRVHYGTLLFAHQLVLVVGALVVVAEQVQHRVDAQKRDLAFK